MDAVRKKWMIVSEKRLWILLLAVAVPLWPQSCDPDPSTRKVMEQVELPDDLRLPTADRQNQKIAVFLYLAANSQVGHKTKEAIANLKLSIDLAPSFWLPHLLLAEIYSANAYRDEALVALHGDRFPDVCTASVRSFALLRGNKDHDLIARTAVRIRRNMAGRMDSEAVTAYAMLWRLEAALQSSDQQAENVKKMRADMDRLFAPEFTRNQAWLSTLREASFQEDHVRRALGQLVWSLPCRVAVR